MVPTWAARLTRIDWCLVTPGRALTDGVSWAGAALLSPKGYSGVKKTQGPPDPSFEKGFVL